MSLLALHQGRTREGVANHAPDEVETLPDAVVLESEWAGAVANGHAGAVLDGAVRDLTEIRRDYDFPVYARAVSPGTTLGRYRTVASQVPVCVAGIMVHPGDIIVGDIDGVVVVPQAKAAEVLAMALEIDARELEQAKLIIAEKSLRKGLAKYGRI